LHSIDGTSPKNVEKRVLVDGKVRRESGFPLSLERDVFGNNVLLYQL
jgi:hypothetical protein